MRKKSRQPRHKIDDTEIEFLAIVLSSPKLFPSSNLDFGTIEFGENAISSVKKSIKDICAKFKK